MNDITVNLWLDEIVNLKEQIAVLENKKKEIEDSIKDLMGDLEEFETDKYNVKWSKYDMPKFDQKKFKESSPAIYQTYVTMVPQRRFSFSKRKGVNVA